MTVGLKILGAHGAVQIDENYANLLLLSKATVTLTGSYGNSGCEYVDVALTGCTSTVLALRCNYHCTCFLMTKSGTTWTYRIVVAPDSGGSLPSGATVTYYRSEEHTSELQSLMRISYAVFCLKKKKKKPRTKAKNEPIQIIHIQEK